MGLTVWNRLKLCWEILSITSGHNHTAQDKQLSTFVKGYECGMNDRHLAACYKQKNNFL